MFADAIRRVSVGQAPDQQVHPTFEKLVRLAGIEPATFGSEPVGRWDRPPGTPGRLLRQGTAAGIGGDQSGTRTGAWWYATNRGLLDSSGEAKSIASTYVGPSTLTWRSWARALRETPEQIPSAHVKGDSVPRTLHVALVDDPPVERRTVLGAGGLDRQKLTFDVEEHDALPADLQGDPLPLRDVVERGHLRKRCHI